MLFYTLFHCFRLSMQFFLGGIFIIKLQPGADGNYSALLLHVSRNICLQMIFYEGERVQKPFIIRSTFRDGCYGLPRMLFSAEKYL